MCATTLGAVEYVNAYECTINELCIELSEIISASELITAIILSSLINRCSEVKTCAAMRLPVLLPRGPGTTGETL